MEFKGKMRGVICMMIIVALTSCADVFNSNDYNVKNVKASPSLDFPLAYGSLVIQDFIAKAQANIQVDQDGLVYLLYDQTLKTQGIGNLLNFPNKSFNINSVVPGGTLPASNTELKIATISSTQDFGFNPELLSEIQFKSTVLNLSSTTVPSVSNLEVEITLSSFKLNGTPFVKRFPVNSSAMVSTVDLTDYVATLNNNQFSLNIDVYELPHGGTQVIPASTITIDLGFDKINYRYVKGFFGDQTNNNLPGDTINFKAFGTAFTNANVSFAAPQLSFTVSNDFGIPTNVTFNPLAAKKNNGSQLNILLNPASPISVNAPVQLGQSAITDVVVTNAKQLIDFAPDQLYYKLSARINQGLTSGNNFCADTSKLRVNFNAKIPLYGKASNIVLADTFAVDLTNAKNSNIQSGSFLSWITNEIPLDAYIQLYLADDKAVIFDSLFTTAQTALVKSSTVNAQGELQSASTSDQTIDLPQDKLNNIFVAKKVIVKARMNTTQDASGNLVDVKFKATYKLTVNFGLKVKLKLQYNP
jgi:hypothetical protein